MRIDGLKKWRKNILIHIIHNYIYFPADTYLRQMGSALHSEEGASWGQEHQPVFGGLLPLNSILTGPIVPAIRGSVKSQKS